MSQKTQNAIIYIERSRLTLLVAKFENKKLTLNFSPTYISDLEVLNGKRLEEELVNLTKQNRLPFLKIVIILAADMCAERNLPKNSKNPLSLETERFLDLVPFRESEYKIFHDANRIKIIAMNKDFNRQFILALKTAGHTVESVVPYFALSKFFPVGKMPVDKIIIQALSKFENLKSSGFQKEHSPIPTVVNSSTFTNKIPPPKKKSTVIYTAPLLILMLLALSGLAINGTKTDPGRSRATVIPTTHQITNNNLKEPVVSPDANTQISQKSPAKGLPSIKIINGSGIPGQDTILKEELEKQGFEIASLEESQNVNSPDTLIIFNQNLSKSTKEIIAAIVKKSFAKISLSENRDTQYDVTVIIGKVV